MFARNKNQQDVKRKGLTTAATLLNRFSQNILAVRLLMYVILANASRSDWHLLMFSSNLETDLATGKHLYLTSPQPIRKMVELQLESPQFIRLQNLIMPAAKP